jgi:hypothetical protein
MAHDRGTILLENATIVKRNFAGKEGQYNSEGERNFLVLLDPEIADQMAEDGWLVKTFAPGPDSDFRQPFVQVKVFYGLYPPRINMITSRGRTPVDESEVEILDWVDIKTVDMVLRPNNWSVNGKSGKKAYLKTMYVTIEEDALETKYRDIDELPSRGGRVD